MHINESFIQELKHESENTRRMLERIPEDSFSWKPHPHSRSIGELASHIAEVPFWINVTMTHHEYDLADANYTPSNAASHAELMKLFEYNLEMAIDELERSENDLFSVPWTMRKGEHVLFTIPRIQVLRSMIMNHLVHHRGQLSVYLRLLNIPVPGIYGPSYDDENPVS